LSFATLITTVPAFSGNLNVIAKLTFGDYVVMGMKHIWSGIDHLLFLFGLLMARGQSLII